MTRDILFHGKRIDNDKWVRGYYVHLHSDKGRETHRIYTGYAETDCEDYYPDWFDVDPVTVGQYTGLVDKNGKRIFEGDIIAIPFEEDRSPWEENNTYYENGEVYFDIERYGWYVKFPDDEISLWEFDECSVEIVGNIYDNPKLQIKRCAQGNDIE